MRSLFAAVLLTLLSVPLSAPLSVSAAAAPPPRATAEEREVATVFESARSALADHRGSDVVPLLSRASVRSLEAVRAAARTPGDSAVERLEPAERFAAMGLRRYVNPAELRRMSLGDLADHGLKQGWLGPNIIAGSSLGPVRVKGDRASGLLMVDNRPALVPADFVREGGQWRIDLAGVFAFGSQMLKGFAAMSGKDETAYIADLLDKLPPPKPAVLRR